ncbi:MAG: Rpn family recombination-promoting nuclease/putative transposase, partial [Fimbriiglobus sp.]
PAEPLDADLSTVSPQADKLFRVGSPVGGLIHLELQSSRTTDLPAQLHLYNTFAAHRHDGPVRTVLLLLRPEALGPDLTGTFTRADEAGEYLRFRYRLVRLWEQPAEPLLTGPPGLIPLGLLTDDAAPRLPELLRRADERLQDAKLPTHGHEEVLSACHILLGLRYENALIQGLFRGLRTMRESTTYQAILAEGRTEGESRGRAEGELRGLRDAILDAAGGRFGDPAAAVDARLEAIADRERLRRISRRLAVAADWDDLLGTA